LLRRRVSDPIYKHGVELCVGDFEAFLQVVRRATGDESYGKERGEAVPAARTVQWTDSKGNVGHWIWFEEWKGTHGDVARLAHEAYHHAVNVMGLIGCKDEEATAYYLQHIVREALAALKRA
jgi:hypothetical protein